MPKIRYNNDIRRDLQTYEYLLQISGFERGTFPEEEVLFKMWIQKHKDHKEKDKERKFISRLLESLNNSTNPPELSLYRLVEILTAIDEYFDRQQEKKENLRPKILDHQDKIRVIRKYCELTRDEKAQLNLPIDNKSFIQENINTCVRDQKDSKLTQNQEEGLFYLSSQDNGKQTIGNSS